MSGSFYISYSTIRRGRARLLRTPPSAATHLAMYVLTYVYLLEYYLSVTPLLRPTLFPAVKSGVHDLDYRVPCCDRFQAATG